MWEALYICGVTYLCTSSQAPRTMGAKVFLGSPLLLSPHRFALLNDAVTRRDLQPPFELCESPHLYRQAITIGWQKSALTRSVGGAAHAIDCEYFGTKREMV